MTNRNLSLIAGTSYLVIFFTAIYANFFVLDSILADPVGTLENANMHVRFGAIAFLIAAVCDTIVAWVLYRLYPEHPFSLLSTFFRLMHAAIMGLAVYALIETLPLTSGEAILAKVDTFNTLWLIGLFFFGFHLMLLGRIVRHIKIIPYMLMFAGAMYIIDTVAHFVMPNYAAYASIFLTLVAVPSIFGEMAFSLWLLFKGGNDRNTVDNFPK